jgi:hypothetical protein
MLKPLVRTPEGFWIVEPDEPRMNDVDVDITKEYDDSNDR